MADSVFIILGVEQLREPELPVFIDRELFDAREFLRFLRRSARFLLGVSAGAALLALLISFVLPKQYTAVATVLIDSPAGGDPRAAVAMNPAYIESLRAYEMLASSDSLFRRSADQFHLLTSGAGSLARMKQRVLRVTKIRDTKVLEIAVTLPDAQQAQAMAQFLAEQTVSMSRAAAEGNDRDLLDAAQKDLQQANAKLAVEQAAWSDFNSHQPAEPLRAELETLTEARSLLQSDLLDSRANAAEADAGASMHARVRSLEDQDTNFDRRIRETAKSLAERDASAERLQQQKDTAQAFFSAAAIRLRDLQAQEGMRGERLRVFDAGVVPDRPSSPNLPLNVSLAFAAGLICAVIYLAVVFDARHAKR